MAGFAQLGCQKIFTSWPFSRLCFPRNHEAAAHAPVGVAVPITAGSASLKDDPLAFSRSACVGVPDGFTSIIPLIKPVAYSQGPLSWLVQLA